MSKGPGFRSLHASFFFVDIVGLSDPGMSTAIQARKIQFLNESISKCQSYASASPDQMLVLPTGDGMAIGFLQAPELPLKLAIELHEKIKAYNKGRLPNELVRVRIGIHSGPVFIIKDIRNNDNVWGQGIIIARRIMDLGDDGHILLSARVAEDLRQPSHEYSQIIHPMERNAVKHNVEIMIYSAYGKNFGNQKLPSKMKSRIDDFLYTELAVNLSIADPANMIVHYKRAYEIQNISDRPAVNVTHQIATDVEKSFSDLKIKVYDEKGKPLCVSSIDLDTMQQKEFATSFATPLPVGAKSRYYLEYEVEEPERYFENVFFTNCKKFRLALDWPSNAPLRPKLFEVNSESGEKHPSEIKGRSKKMPNKRSTIQWELDDLSRGQAFRIEW